MKIIVG